MANEFAKTGLGMMMRTMGIDPERLQAEASQFGVLVAGFKVQLDRMESDLQRLRKTQDILSAALIQNGLVKPYEYLPETERTENVESPEREKTSGAKE